MLSKYTTNFLLSLFSELPNIVEMSPILSSTAGKKDNLGKFLSFPSGGKERKAVINSLCVHFQYRPLII